MDDKTKAKALMAAGLFMLATIGLAVVLVVLPAIRSGGGSQSALAQGGAPGAPGAPGGMPGAPGGMPGAPGAAPGAAAPGGAAVAAAGAPGRVVEPLEKSRPNPFVVYSGAGLLAARPSAGLAFAPSYHTMPVGVFQQHRFPTPGAQGQSIKVRAAVSLRLPAGPEAPPQEEYLQIKGVFYDNQGRAAVILQREGRDETYRVGDRFNDVRNPNIRWTVQSIAKDEMVLSRQEGGKTITRTVHFIRGGGAGKTGGVPGPPGPGGNQPRQPGAAGPGGGGARQPGARRPGGGGGGFPGVQAPGGRPQGAPGGAGAQ